ncbi:hypothetical protein PT974_03276 [Cladobotryum mycophilum]|uniref:Uncharacterized protein n=1 Tax=Cladobotryum mycophilum TaxID=491253 RepID=A0ABR0SRZ2_9HYPO
MAIGGVQQQQQQQQPQSLGYSQGQPQGHVIAINASGAVLQANNANVGTIRQDQAPRDINLANSNFDALQQQQQQQQQQQAQLQARQQQHHQQQQQQQTPTNSNSNSTTISSNSHLHRNNSNNRSITNSLK